MLRVIRSLPKTHILDVLDAVKSIEEKCFTVTSINTIKTPRFFYKYMLTHIHYHRQKKRDDLQVPWIEREF